jgi:hypothetical protein
VTVQAKMKVISDHRFTPADNELGARTAELMANGGPVCSTFPNGREKAEPIVGKF